MGRKENIGDAQKKKEKEKIGDAQNLVFLL
jgi:hypothetical protein